jgi:protein-tyrosine phosphatase
MGRSRSILVAAVYLVYTGAFATLDAALDKLKRLRGIKMAIFPRSELRALGEALLTQQPNLLREL